MKIIVHPFTLHLKETFRISRYERDSQRTLVIELNEGGISGFGEATENPYYGITLEKMIGDLEKVRPVVEHTNWETPEVLWHQLIKLLPDNLFLIAAIDIASHDLLARKKGKTLIKHWELPQKPLPITSYTIGIDTVDKMIAKIQAKPWPAYKIKLGTPDDLSIIQSLRKHTDATFRVDANCAWTLDQAINLSKEFKSLGVEFIEQPLPADKWEEMQVLYAESALPVIADESCLRISDVEKCAGAFHGINIKLMKCGGYTAALKMIELARKLRLKIMVGCMTESTVGISAIGQLLPLLDYVDMDGAMLISNDIASGIQIEDGKYIFPDWPGTGVVLM
ncbi:dipeptide epimerase [bacterium]|nr:dipeptide epimerase [bacterium]